LLGGGEKVKLLLKKGKRDPFLNHGRLRNSPYGKWNGKHKTIIKGGEKGNENLRRVSKGKS